MPTEVTKWNYLNYILLVKKTVFDVGKANTIHYTGNNFKTSESALKLPTDMHLPIL